MANEDRLPQFDRAKIKTPIGFFSTLFRLMRISEEFAIPAIVKEYNRNTGIVKVQPLVSNLADDINNQEVEIPRSEYEVHVVRFAHGGYVVDAPLFVGDTGWLIAGDRNSTSAIKANSTILEEDQTDENSPNEGYKKPDDNSLKSFAWGFFIPDTWGITDFTEEDGLVVRGQRISVESDHVTVECGENSASISKESINIDTKKCSIEIKEDYASVISEKYGAKIDGNGAIVKGPNDKISIDDNGLHHEGAVDEKRDIISAIEYDKKIGDLVKKSFSVSKRGDFIVDIDEETDWERLGLPNSTSVNDGKLTIKQGDNTLGEFTANQEDNTTIIIPEPPAPSSVIPDDVSTEFIPEQEDENKLQIFDFDSSESDSPEGLAERLHADTKTGDIKIQSGTNIMLLARRDGKMVYIPLTAGGTDPEDEKPYDPENPDPCAHPGDNAPGAETHSGVGGGGGVPVGGGGVPAGGDVHTGDDDCNCERI